MESAARAPEIISLQPRTEASARAPKLAAEIATVFANLLGRIDLLRDSAAVIAAEYGDRGAVYRALASVERGDDMANEWKKLRGAPGWWERHIPTGESDAGRIYACLGGDRRWKVLISHKGQQARDIDWLRSAGRL